MPLYLYNGKLLVDSGKLATSINCCCPWCEDLSGSGCRNPIYVDFNTSAVGASGQATLYAGSGYYDASGGDPNFMPPTDWGVNVGFMMSCTAGGYWSVTITVTVMWDSNVPAITTGGQVIATARSPKGSGCPPAGAWTVVYDSFSGSTVNVT